MSTRPSKSGSAYRSTLNDGFVFMIGNIWSFGPKAEKGAIMQENTKLKRRWLSSSKIHWGYLLLCFFVLFPGSKIYAVSDICIPTFDGVTGRPTIDGDIINDIGWTNAALINLGKDGGVEYRANLRLVKDSNFVFLGVQSKRDIGESASEDVLILRFIPPSSPQWHIQLQPFANGGALKVWLQDGASGWIEKTATVGAGNWLQTDVVATKNAAGDMWFLEMKIPRAASPTSIEATDPTGPGIYFGSAGEFGFYINVMNSIEEVIPGFSIQAAWPPDARITSSLSIEDLVGFDNYVVLADCSLSPRSECTGVSLDRFAIGTTNTPDSQIRLYQPEGSPLTAADCPPPTDQGGLTNIENTFKALPENSMSSDAEDVTVTYKVATWGLPPLDDKLWYEIGSTGEHNISPTPPPIASSTFHFPWAPTYEKSCIFLERTHQCMVAIMSSTDVNTRFLNDSARRNMDFVTASSFERDAEISAIGYGDPPEGQNNKHAFLLAVEKKVQRYELKGKFYMPIGRKAHGATATKAVLSTDSSRTETQALADLRKFNRDIIPIPVSIAGKGVKEAMTWITRGYLKTGEYITIGDKRFQIVQDLGGFGYIASHKGVVDKWNSSLTGKDLESIKDDSLYNINIPPGETRTIKTQIEAIQPPLIRRCFSLFPTK